MAVATAVALTRGPARLRERGKCATGRHQGRRQAHGHGRRATCCAAAAAATASTAAAATTACAAAATATASAAEPATTCSRAGAGTTGSRAVAAPIWSVPRAAAPTGSTAGPGKDRALIGRGDRTRRCEKIRRR